MTPLPALPEQTPKHAKPRAIGAGFSDVTDIRDFFTFPLDRRCADALRAQTPHLQPERYFLSPLRRQDSARLSGVTDAGDFFTLPLDRRCTDTLSAPTSKNVHGSSLPCTFSICFCPRLRRGRRVPGSGCAAARGRGPGADCRRHSSDRGSAAGCAGRRLRPP